MGLLHSVKFLGYAWLDFTRYYLAGRRNGFDRTYFQHVTGAWSRGLLRSAGVDFQVDGAENLPAGPFLIAANHQSYLDIPLLVVALGDHKPIFIMKQELLKVPLLGRLAVAAGAIAINRGDRRQAVAAIEEGLRQVKPGEAVMMFPEGTRTRTGKMGTAKKGVFYFAIHTGLPIAPVAITGSFDRFPKDHFFSINPGPVRVQILPAISPDPDRGDDQVNDLVERWVAVVQTAVGELEPATGAAAGAL